MKIGIITVFKSENSGSFLQAWALKEQLSSMGCDTYFCDYKANISVFKRTIIGAVKSILKLKFRIAIDIIRKTADYCKIQRMLNINKQYDDTDFYIFGSDTLWNFEDSFFKKETPFFTGSNIKKPCYTYSISIASTSKKSFLENTVAVDNIKKFKKIAVRDEHTESVVSSFYPKENISRTVDPTMLLDKETYIKNFCTKRPCKHKYLVVYHFGEIQPDTWKDVVSFAKSNDLKIMNVGLYNSKFDLSIPASPENFISAFSNAEYIFTNTFHGCIFSTIFNKQFATDGAHKKKIQGYLEEFSLLDRIVSESGDVKDVFSKQVDYNKINALIDEKRLRSIDYLNNAIHEVQLYEQRN